MGCCIFNSRRSLYIVSKWVVVSLTVDDLCIPKWVVVSLTVDDLCIPKWVVVSLTPWTISVYLSGLLYL